MSNVVPFLRPKRHPKPIRTSSRPHELVARALAEGFFRRWALDPIIVTDDNACRPLSGMDLEDQYTIIEGLERAAEIHPAICCLWSLLWIPDTTRGDYMHVRLRDDLLQKCGHPRKPGNLRIPAEDSSPAYDIDYQVAEPMGGFND